MQHITATFLVMLWKITAIVYSNRRKAPNYNGLMASSISEVILIDCFSINYHLKSSAARRSLWTENIDKDFALERGCFIQICILEFYF